MGVTFYLSQDAGKAMEALLSPRTGVRFLLPTTDRNMVLLEQLAQHVEPALIPGLAAFAVSAPADERRKANEVLVSILNPLGAKELLEIDQSIRVCAWMPDLVARRWTKVTPGDVDRLSDSSPTLIALLAVLSLHPSGYVREAAVRALGNHPVGPELRYLLVRLNDWVPAVRSVAQNAVHARLRPEFASAFATNLDMIARLLVWERVDHAPLLRWIVGYLRDPTSADAVEAALATVPFRERRVAYRLLMDVDGEPPRRLLNRALDDGDSIVRLQALRTARRRLAVPELTPILHDALQDSFAAVRLEGARGLSDAYSEDLKPAFTSLLLDPASSVRMMARYALTRGSTLSMADFYEEHIAAGSVRVVRVALLGLAETGDRTRVSAVLPLLKHPSTGIAATALRTLAMLDGDNHLPLLTDALNSQSPGIVREAIRALSPRIRSIELRHVWAAVSSRPWGATRRRLTGLLSRGAKWDVLPYLLRLIRDSEPAAVSFAKDRIAHWFRRFNRQATTPSSEQVVRIRQELAELGPELSPKEREAIRFYCGR